jgi:hypothetical protein
MYTVQAIASVYVATLCEANHCKCIRCNSIWSKPLQVYTLQLYMKQTTASVYVATLYEANRCTCIRCNSIWSKPLQVYTLQLCVKQTAASVYVAALYEANRCIPQLTEVIWILRANQKYREYLSLPECWTITPKVHFIPEDLNLQQYFCGILMYSK